MRSKQFIFFLAVAFVTLRSAASAQVQPQPLSAKETSKIAGSFVEFGGNYSNLSSGFGTWSGGYFRGVWTRGRNVWNAEITGQQEFGDQGGYFALGDTYTFNPNWYASLTLGTCAGGFFYPRIRADGFLNRKWLVHRQLVTSIGFGYYRAKDPHRDKSISLGAVYYFTRPWIIEGGVRLNFSNPGAVFSETQFLAITQGRDKHHYITLRAGFGTEAYQLVGPARVISDFHSHEVSLTWRQWLHHRWGYNLMGEFYGNPSYRRSGVSFGIFREF